MLDAIYNRTPLILWVEDKLTVYYLEALWNEPRIKILIAGGCETIKATVEDALRRNHKNVYGFRDRDFGKSNRARWQTSTSPLFTSDTFEIECFLLSHPQSLTDAGQALGLNTNKTAQTITEKINSIGLLMLWWMATRKVLHELSSTIQFPGHPKYQEAKNQQDAEAYIQSKWTTISQNLRTVSEQAAQANIQSLLTAARSHYQSFFTSGALNVWLPHFSGKEILSSVLQFIWPSRTPNTPDALNDLAKSIAAAQITHNTIPKELDELRNALLARLP